MSIVVAKLQNSFSEPSCQQASRIRTLFSSTPWSIYVALREQAPDVHYLELPVDEDYETGNLADLRNALEAGDRNTLVLCGGISGLDVHTRNLRDVCVSAKGVGAKIAVLGTFHGYEAEFREWAGADTIVTALDRMRAVQMLWESGFFGPGEPTALPPAFFATQT